MGYVKAKSVIRITKTVLVLLCVGLVAVLTISSALRILFGAQFKMGRPRMQTHILENKRQSPLAVVRVKVSGPSASAITDSVGIYAYNEIYEAIGVNQKGFADWEGKHGMDSSGVDDAENVLAPGYPVLSKVAWMYIDPVTLTSAETSALIQECHRAIINSASESAKYELEAISSLADKAIANSAVIQFGHP